MAFATFQPIVAASAASTQSSLAIDGAHIINIGVQLVCSASMSGTVKLQGSNDPAFGYNPGPQGSTNTTQNPSNWSDIPNATATLSSATNGAFFVSNVAFRWYRVVWTPSGSPSGTVTAQVHHVGL